MLLWVRRGGYTIKFDSILFITLFITDNSNISYIKSLNHSFSTQQDSTDYIYINTYNISVVSDIPEEIAAKLIIGVLAFNHAYIERMQTTYKIINADIDLQRLEDWYL